MADFNFIRYANCWEDTENLIKCLEENKKVLSISSAGDNVLGMLTKNPEKIVAFDINDTELNLLRLKIAAFKELSYEEILILLGIKKGDSIKIFKKLEKSLDTKTYQYFNNNIKILRKGIIHSGKFEHYFQLFRKYIIPLFSTKKKIYKLATCETIEEQRDYYNEKIKNKRLDKLFNFFFGFKVMGKYGRDKSFYDYVPDKENSVVEIKERFNKGINTIANKTNPYMTYILLNHYTENALPYYLRKENYEIIKNNIDKISIVKGPLTSIKDKFNYFNLSDIFEYMSDSEFKENIEHLYSITENNSKVVYYNMQSKRYLDEKFILNNDISTKLKEENMSYFYRDILVYEKRI